MHGHITGDQFSAYYSSGKVTDSNILKFGDDLDDIYHRHSIDFDEFKRLTEEYYYICYKKKASDILFLLINEKVTIKGYALDGSML